MTLSSSTVAFTSFRVQRCAQSCSPPVPIQPVSHYKAYILYILEFIRLLLPNELWLSSLSDCAKWIDHSRRAIFGGGCAWHTTLMEFSFSLMLGGSEKIIQFAQFFKSISLWKRLFENKNLTLSRVAIDFPQSAGQQVNEKWPAKCE